MSVPKNTEIAKGIRRTDVEHIHIFLDHRDHDTPYLVYNENGSFPKTVRISKEAASVLISNGMSYNG